MKTEKALILLNRFPIRVSIQIEIGDIPIFVEIKKKDYLVYINELDKDRELNLVLVHDIASYEYFLSIKPIDFNLFDSDFEIVEE